jgi:hypothetical protein
MTTTMWILGFIAGLATVVVTEFLFTLGIAMMVVVSLLRPRPAAAGGACVAWGGAFLIAMWQAADRCAAFNRQPNASCTMGDNTPFAIVGVAVLALGLALSAYAILRARMVAVPSSP